MKCLNLILIAFLSSTVSNAIYILSNKFSLRNYALARTKVHIFNTEKNKGSLEVTISNESHRIFLKPNKIPHSYTNVSEILFIDGNITTKKKFTNYPWNIVEGFVEDSSNNSGVNGYIKKGDFFYGTIISKNKSYYVEEMSRFPLLASSGSNKDFNAVIYSEDSISNENEENKWHGRILRRAHHEKISMNEAASKIIYKQFITDRHICPLLVVSDNSFIEKIHKNDKIAAVSQVMLSINEVNSVFRSTDFDDDGSPDNIGFVIKYLVIIENENSPFNYIPPYSDQPVSPRFYLAHFAQYLILREVCLGILFTAQPFQDNVLGVSYSAVSESDISNDIIGGICQRPFTSYMSSLNAVAVSYISTQGSQLPQGTLDTCLTHESGHAFGCRHDRKSDPGYNEEYIMSSHTLPGTSARNFQFSPMSKKHLVMTVPKKGHCMSKSTEPFCGNGMSEQEEECDCGAKYLCQVTDPCCIPSGMNGACQINRPAGHECHPSQGYCCTADCKYENSEKIGVDCRSINRTCPCENGNCECGIGGRCLGKECQSEECVRIDAAECDCPPSSIQDYCNICCSVNSEGPCLPSRNSTQWKLESGLVSIKQLETFDALRTMPNATEFERFCHGIDCITLAFKKFNVGDFCLKNGKLGKCGIFGCSFENSNSFEMEKKARQIEMMRSSSCTLSLYLYVIYCFCTIQIKFFL